MLQAGKRSVLMRVTPSSWYTAPCAVQEAEAVVVEPEKCKGKRKHLLAVVT